MKLEQVNSKINDFITELGSSHNTKNLVRKRCKSEKSKPSFLDELNTYHNKGTLNTIVEKANKKRQ